jgi:hypothetical protein
MATNQIVKMDTEEEIEGFRVVVESLGKDLTAALQYCIVKILAIFVRGYSVN